MMNGLIIAHKTFRTSIFSPNLRICVLIFHVVCDEDSVTFSGRSLKTKMFCLVETVRRVCD